MKKRISYEMPLNEIQWCVICNLIPNMVADHLVNFEGCNNVSDISNVTDESLLKAHGVGKKTVSALREFEKKWADSQLYITDKNEYRDFQIEHLSLRINLGMEEMIKLMHKRYMLIEDNASKGKSK